MIEKMRYEELNKLVSYSTGNEKLGEFTPNVSLPTIGICKKLPCYNRCYAVRLYKYPNVKTAWDRNLRLYKGDSEKYFRVLSRCLEISVPYYFRWHVGGELPSSKYLLGIVKLAEKHQRTKFLLYTKRYSLLSRLSSIPKNLVILMSVWPGLKYPKDYPFRRAFTVKDIDQCDGVRCIGYCPDCRACWDDDRDIVFKLR